MAGTVTKLSFQKRNSERVNVHLDGRYAFAVPAIEAARLKRGQFLSDAEIDALRALDSRQRAYDRVLRLLSHRPRSEVEVRRYLKRKETPPEVIDEVVERLQRDGYLNDAAFARFWVENRERNNPRGVWALRQELRQKGVAQPLIESALAGLDTEDGAYRALDRRRRRWQRMEHAEYRRLAGGYLARRGFDYGVARDALDRMWAEIGPEDVEE
jgi:regulatory protein